MHIAHGLSFRAYCTVRRKLVFFSGEPIDSGLNRQLKSHCQHTPIPLSHCLLYAVSAICEREEKHRNKIFSLNVLNVFRDGILMNSVMYLVCATLVEYEHHPDHVLF